MKDLNLISENSQSKNLTELNLFTESDIQKIRNEFCKPNIGTSKPSGLFEGLSYKYISDENTGLRKALRSKNLKSEYFEGKKANYQKILSNFENLEKIEVKTKEGKSTGIFIINFFVKSNSYITIYFDFQKVKSELNQMKGEQIKK